MIKCKNVILDETVFNLNISEGVLFDNVGFYNRSTTDINKYQIGVIAFDQKVLNTFREKFYTLGDHFELKILDFGIIDLDSKQDQIEVIQTLNKSIPLIVLGGDMDFKSKSFSAIVTNNICTNDDKLSFIGYQRHRVKIKDYLELQDFQHLSLGELRQNSSLLEPLLRRCKIVSVDLTAIKSADSLLKQSDVCGLSLEEACQIMRYAGISPDMELLHFKNLENLESFVNGDAKYESAAITSWYFLEGWLNKTYETPEDASNINYVIQNDYFDHPLTFIKSSHSGRWWLKLENSEIGYLPCLIDDYHECKEGHVPERLVSNLIQ